MRVNISNNIPFCAPLGADHHVQYVFFSRYKTISVREAIHMPDQTFLVCMLIHFFVLTFRV